LQRLSASPPKRDANAQPSINGISSGASVVWGNGAGSTMTGFANVQIRTRLR
jgi:hypothetical protein